LGSGSFYLTYSRRCSFTIAESQPEFELPFTNITKSTKDEEFWKKVYTPVPAVLEAGCVTERILFNGIRPNFSVFKKNIKIKQPAVAAYPRKVFDALLAGKDIPAPPAGFPTRVDHVTGLDCTRFEKE